MKKTENNSVTENLKLIDPNCRKVIDRANYFVSSADFPNWVTIKLPSKKETVFEEKPRPLKVCSFLREEAINSRFEIKRNYRTQEIIDMIKIEGRNNMLNFYNLLLKNMDNDRRGRSNSWKIGRAGSDIAKDIFVEMFSPCIENKLGRSNKGQAFNAEHYRIPTLEDKESIKSQFIENLIKAGLNNRDAKRISDITFEKALSEIMGNDLFK
jgi:hypothetical protein